MDLPAVSEKDISDLKFGVEQGVDMVFASFIRKAEDVDAVRSVLGDKGKHILIVSKVYIHEFVVYTVIAKVVTVSVCVYVLLVYQASVFSVKTCLV